MLYFHKEKIFINFYFDFHSFLHFEVLLIVLSSCKYFKDNLKILDYNIKRTDNISQGIRCVFLYLRESHKIIVGKVSEKIVLLLD